MMQPPTELSQDLVLVGGGHAHVIALRMLAMEPISGLRITLVSPESHTPYSGMLPGLIAGHYSFEEAHIDLARLCQWAGVRFLQTQVTAIHPQARLLSLKGRPQIQYDLLSLDTGSEPELDSVPGARDWAVPVKPVADLWLRWSKLSEKLQNSDARHRVAVVGGGAGSVELIMAMAQYFLGRDIRFTLYCGGSEILQGYNQRARKSVGKALARLGIELRLDSRVATVEHGELIFSDQSRREFDELFWCTGAAASPWIADSGLQTDERGFLAIRDSLQAIAYDNIFAAGDVATQLNHQRPKAGVYAVRQGPVLSHNLRSYLLGRPLKNHSPQQRFLSLISLGGKCATADRSLFSATGAWVWRWKDRIDREFMSRFEDLPETMSQVHVDSLSAGKSDQRQMPCGGCGAKVGSESLGRVLADLALEFPQHCPNGGQATDAATLPGSVGLEIVQSIDVLREIVSDPWIMGRIAANHALSDLYASGARPLSALATITLPFASAELQERELKQLLAGALHEFALADCMLQGGHSLQGQELNIGFAVNGSALSAERGFLRKRGLKNGDHLILAKPLGTGALFSSHMQLKANGRDIHSAVNSMLQSNAGAAKLAVDFGVSACTDVTGFGLLGHLLEMLADDQGASLRLAKIPLLPGAQNSISSGAFSSMHDANAVAKNSIGEVAEGADQARVDLLVDPQTSGGLLMGVAAEKAETLLCALRAAGYPYSAIIGEVTLKNASGQLKLL
jgi:selenide,water dikinase